MAKKKEKATSGNGPIIKVLDIEHVAAGHRKTYLSKKNLKALVEAANAEQGIPLYLGEAFDADGDALANSDEPIGMLINWTNQWDEWIEAVAEGLSDELIERIDNDWSLHAVQLALPLDDAGKRLADDPTPIEVYLLPTGRPPELVENFDAGYIEITTGWNGAEVGADATDAIGGGGEDRGASDARFLPHKITGEQATAKNRELEAHKQHLGALAVQMKGLREVYGDRLREIDESLSEVAAKIIASAAGIGGAGRCL